MSSFKNYSAPTSISVPRLTNSLSYIVYFSYPTDPILSIARYESFLMRPKFKDHVMFIIRKYQTIDVAIISSSVKKYLTNSCRNFFDLLTKYTMGNIGLLETNCQKRLHYLKLLRTHITAILIFQVVKTSGQI